MDIVVEAEEPLVSFRGHVVQKVLCYLKDADGRQHTRTFHAEIKNFHVDPISGRARFLLEVDES